MIISTIGTGTALTATLGGWKSFTQTCIDIGEKAKSRGLTQEKLAELLSDVS